MFYDSMIKNENSDVMYENWQEYREELTATVISFIESYHIKRELQDKRNIRVSGDYGLKDIVSKMDIKPVLAIWGAGGCNDIDVKKLSEYFRLVLIDHDVDAVTKAIKRFQLPQDTVVMDMKFWDVSHDEYRMFEALLADGNLKEIKDYLQELSSNMPSYDLGVEAIFDYSMVVGLASQLNARFMALLEKYPNIDRNFVAGVVGEMNKKAVDALWSKVHAATRHLALFGYEADYLDKNSDEVSEKEAELLYKKEHLDEDAEERLWDGQLPYWIEENLTNIMGSKELEQKIKLADETKEYNGIANCRGLIWNFTGWKSYLMLLVALER